MADTNNARLWGGASIYYGDSTATAPIDVDTAWGTGWSPIGFIHPDEGITESRDQSTNSFFGWGPSGQILIRRVNSQHQRTFTFQCLEENETVFTLVNPGSPTPTVDGTSGLIERRIHVPAQKRFKIGMELTVDAVTTRRFTDTSEAELASVGDKAESATGLMVRPVTIIIYPDDAGELYAELTNAPSGS